MACVFLVVVMGYIALVVVVAISHWPSHTTDTSSSGSITGSNSQSAQQRWKDIKQQRGLVDVPPKSEKTKKQRDNPFSKHNLGTPLRHGVEPEVLLPHTAKEDLPVAVKEDVDPQHHPTPDNILTAYQEPLDYDDWSIQPLPLRKTAQADRLKAIQYTRLRSCRNLPQQWPVDDSPVDGDAFLPWIHDVFPTHDGRYIQIVAQNKRRCKNGSQEKHILRQQQPQAALFQHVSLQRLPLSSTKQDKEEPRFRLAPHEQADADAMATRFLCRFKPDFSVTASVYNFDYDWTAYRKKYKASFLEDDAGIKAIHSSQLIFKCPVPRFVRGHRSSMIGPRSFWTLSPFARRPALACPTSTLCRSTNPNKARKMSLTRRRLGASSTSCRSFKILDAGKIFPFVNRRS
jgi:hypothetical protein